MKIITTRPFNGHRRGERRTYFLQFKINIRSERGQFTLTPENGYSGVQHKGFKEMTFQIGDLAEFLHERSDPYLGDQKAWHWCAKHYGLE